MNLRILFSTILLMLAACTAEVAEEPAATADLPTATIAQITVESTAVPTNPPVVTVVATLMSTVEPAQVEPTELPPTELSPTAAPEPTEVIVEYGRTSEGAFFRGAVDAPVTLIDYSDFL